MFIQAKKGCKLYFLRICVHEVSISSLRNGHRRIAEAYDTKRYVVNYQQS